MDARMRLVFRELADYAEGYSDNDVWSWQVEAVPADEVAALDDAARRVILALRDLADGRLVLAEARDEMAAETSHADCVPRPRRDHVRAILAGAAQWRRPPASGAAP